MSHTDENKSVAVKRLMMLCARHKVFRFPRALGTNCKSLLRPTAQSSIPEFLIQLVWDVALEFASLIGSQMIMIQLV